MSKTKVGPEGDGILFRGREWKLACSCNEWISVKERLPEHSDTMTQLVLVYVIDGEHGFRGHMETSMLYPDGRSWSHIRSEEVVTHWMPLPPAPEDEVKIFKNDDGN